MSEGELWFEYDEFGFEVSATCRNFRSIFLPGLGAMLSFISVSLLVSSISLLSSSVARKSPETI